MNTPAAPSSYLVSNFTLVESPGGDQLATLYFAQAIAHDQQDTPGAADVCPYHTTAFATHIVVPATCRPLEMHSQSPNESAAPLTKAGGRRPSNGPAYLVIKSVAVGQGQSEGQVGLGCAMVITEAPDGAN